MATVPTVGVGGGVFDNTLMFRTTGSLTKTFTSASLHLRGTPVGGLAVRVVFPTTPGLTGAVAMAVHASADNSTFRVISTYPGGAQSWATGGKEFMLPFEVTSGFPYNKLVLTVTGDQTYLESNSWGVVQAGVVLKAHGEWTRNQRWD